MYWRSWTLERGGHRKRCDCPRPANHIVGLLVSLALLPNGNQRTRRCRAFARPPSGPGYLAVLSPGDVLVLIGRRAAAVLASFGLDSSFHGVQAFTTSEALCGAFDAAGSQAGTARRSVESRRAVAIRRSGSFDAGAVRTVELERRARCVRADGTLVY